MFLRVILRVKSVVIRVNFAKEGSGVLHLCGPLLLGHIRDPNNQLHMVKNLRICVNNVATSLSTPSVGLSLAQRRVLGDVVSSCQPQEGGLASVITAGDYHLNVSGKKLEKFSLNHSPAKLSERCSCSNMNAQKAAVEPVLQCSNQCFVFLCVCSHHPLV